MNPKNQKEAIALHLKQFGNITSLEAIKEYGITRLSSIIHTLRSEGWGIISEPITRKNRFGNSVTLAKYVFKHTFKGQLI
tara:strand:- start:406 stop:645 length:240 start_codon:yes stop_codon:yes gene_type:complete